VTDNCALSCRHPGTDGGGEQLVGVWRVAVHGPDRLGKAFELWKVRGVPGSQLHSDRLTWLPPGGEGSRDS